MLRTAGRRLSALQPGLPLADQGSLLLLTTLRDRSACSTPPHAAAPSTTAAAAVGAAAAAAPLTAHSRQHSSRCSNGSNLGGTHRSSSWGEGLLSSSDAGSRPTGGGVLGGSSALRHLGSAAGAPPASTAGRRALHWSSAAAASATRQSRKAGEAALKKTVRTLLPETAVAKYLQDRFGLLEKEAEFVVARIRNFAGPDAHAPRRSRARELHVAEVMAVVEVLAAEMDGVDVAALVRRNPHLLVESPAGQLRENCRQLRAEFQLSSQQLARLATKCPVLLRADLAQNLQPVAALLREWGMNPATLQSVALRYPSIFVYRPESVQERLEWLHEELALSKKMVAGLVHRFANIGKSRLTVEVGHLLAPHVCVCGAAGCAPLPGLPSCPLGASFRSAAMYSAAQLAQGRQWLLDQGVPAHQLVRSVARYPQIITYSDNKRKLWAAFMRKELGLSQAAVARVLVSQPDMAGRSLDLLRTNLDMWQRELRLSPEQLRSMLEAHPAILRLDVSSPTYAAKIEYLRGLLDDDEEALARVLAGHPYYLSYRLDRIVTRAEYLKQLGRLRPEAPTGWLACSEPLFASNVAKTSLAEFTAFKLNLRSSPEGQRLLGPAQQERMRRMLGRRLEQELAAGEDTPADAEQSLRQRIKTLEDRDERLAMAEQMLQRREAGSAAGGAAPVAGQRRQREQGVQQVAAQQQQRLQQQCKLPRLGDELPDFSGDEWTAAAVKQRRRELGRRLQQLRIALDGLMAAPEGPREAGVAP